MRRCCPSYSLSPITTGERVGCYRATPEPRRTPIQLCGVPLVWDAGAESVTSHVPRSGRIARSTGRSARFRATLVPGV
jgi:hypothetical protein